MPLIGRKLQQTALKGVFSRLPKYGSESGIKITAKANENTQKPTTLPLPPTVNQTQIEERIQIQRDPFTGLLVIPEVLSPEQKGKVEWVEAYAQSNNNIPNPAIGNDELLSGGLQSNPERRASATTIEMITTGGAEPNAQMQEVKAFLDQYFTQLAGFRRVIIVADPSGMPPGSGNSMAVNIRIGDNPKERDVYFNASSMTLNKRVRFKAPVNEVSDYEMYQKAGEKDVQTAQYTGAIIASAAVEAKDLDTVEKRLEAAIKYKSDKGFEIAQTYAGINEVFRPNQLDAPNGILEGQIEALRKFGIDIPIDADANGLQFKSPNYTQTPGPDIFSVPASVLPEGKTFTAGKGPDKLIIYEIDLPLTLNTNNEDDFVHASVVPGGELDLYMGKGRDKGEVSVAQGATGTINHDVEELEVYFNNGILNVSKNTKITEAFPGAKGIINWF